MEVIVHHFECKNQDFRKLQLGTCYNIHHKHKVFVSRKQQWGGLP